MAICRCCALVFGFRPMRASIWLHSCTDRFPLSSLSNISKISSNSSWRASFATCLTERMTANVVGKSKSPSLRTQAASEILRCTRSRCGFVWGRMPWSARSTCRSSRSNKPVWPSISSLCASNLSCNSTSSSQSSATTSGSSLPLATRLCSRARRKAPMVSLIVEKTFSHSSSSIESTEISSVFITTNNFSNFSATLPRFADVPSCCRWRSLSSISSRVRFTLSNNATTTLFSSGVLGPMLSWSNSRRTSSMWSLPEPSRSWICNCSLISACISSRQCFMSSATRHSNSSKISSPFESVPKRARSSLKCRFSSRERGV
mmetsp:Transcript_48578/g.139487  ORF Transcript_48578/g.139487 Transcript_48578/m.139487 type:complete len:318 (-) Transcript_48578:186-1139(-)